ncbi:putative quinol monooxygenase [Pseudaminobacter sp. NGMCC 1.201702]|uniref:putative quinol monooxygenase n=1 Tax=Pseudaminobacter sp. NGMCC 1.201702 TaxID=3391825 RepID=UPI0039F07C1E
MLTITAIIKTPKGIEARVRQSLLAIIDDVKKNEPGTPNYFISQDLNDPCVFTTFERFADKAGMDKHNGSAAVAELYAIVKEVGASVTLVTCEEFAIKA